MRNRESGIFFPTVDGSDFVVGDARGFLFVVGDVDLEVGEQRGRFALQHAQARDRHPPDLELRAFADRKSTRLNSSHGYISYAVFCLKKKINPISPAGLRA